MTVWVLVTVKDTSGEYQYWERRYLNLCEGRIEQPTATDRR